MKRCSLLKTKFQGFLLPLLGLTSVGLIESLVAFNFPSTKQQNFVFVSPESSNNLDSSLKRKVSSGEEGASSSSIGAFFSAIGSFVVLVFSGVGSLGKGVFQGLKGLGIGLKAVGGAVWIILKAPFSAVASLFSSGDSSTR